MGLAFCHDTGPIPSTLRRGGRVGGRRFHSGGKLHNWAHSKGYRHPGEMYFQGGGRTGGRNAVTNKVSNYTRQIENRLRSMGERITPTISSQIANSVRQGLQKRENDMNNPMIDPSAMRCSCGNAIGWCMYRKETQNYGNFGVCLGIGQQLNWWA